MNRRASIYTHVACLDHDTGPGHAECPQRLEAVVDALREAFPGAEWLDAPRATRGQLARTHDEALIDRVLNAPGIRVMLDSDTALSPGSPEAALRAAGAGIAATDAVLKGEIDVAFCAVRPPGHHATRDVAMGFCLFDNIAVAAAHALERHGLSRISIIDFDVHHGNGTQAIFEHEPRVQYLSSHQMPLYPDTGNADERGVGNVFNVPLAAGSGSAEFRDAWSTRLLPEIDAFSPELLLVSAGFDAHWRDPLAQIHLDAGDYAWLTGELAAIARRHAWGRMVSMLEGGYDLQALRECSVAHVGALFAA
ncbi:MAG: histone deacetylase family protein [Luteimonas sp.]|nr:histone deacetylase family protein [Luteimonas sp.]